MCKCALSSSGFKMLLHGADEVRSGGREGGQGSKFRVDASQTAVFLTRLCGKAVKYKGTTDGSQKTTTTKN